MEDAGRAPARCWGALRCLQVAARWSCTSPRGGWPRATLARMSCPASTRPRPDHAADGAGAVHDEPHHVTLGGARRTPAPCLAGGVWGGGDRLLGEVHVQHHPAAASLVLTSSSRGIEVSWRLSGGLAPHFPISLHLPISSGTSRGVYALESVKTDWEVRGGARDSAGWWRQRVRDGCCATSLTTANVVLRRGLDKLDHRSAWTTARPRPASGPNSCGALPFAALFDPQQPDAAGPGVDALAGGRCSATGVSTGSTTGVSKSLTTGVSTSSSSGSTRRSPGDARGLLRCRRCGTTG